jgi:FlaA1/EpsC-like NDP-sugar epimerase
MGLRSGLEAVPVPRVGPGSSPVRDQARTARSAGLGVRAWARRYAACLVAVETTAAALAGASVVLTRAEVVQPSTSLFWAAIGLVPAWPLVLLAVGAYSERVFGTGSDEYRRVGRAGFLLLAFAGFISYAAALDLSRALVVVAIPTLTVVTLAVRYAARCQLRRLRARGRCTRRVVVVGRGGAVLDLTARVGREHYAGLDVVALCVTPADRARVAQAASSAWRRSSGPTPSP